MLATICHVSGCPNLAPCPAHRPKPWQHRITPKRNYSDPEYTRNRTIVLEQAGYRCAQCGAPTRIVDHISRTAGHELTNLQALCIRCHNRKTAVESRRGRQ